jgi:hypothetical protein
MSVAYHVRRWDLLVMNSLSFYVHEICISPLLLKDLCVDIEFYGNSFSFSILVYFFFFSFGGTGV